MTSLKIRTGIETPAHESIVEQEVRSISRDDMIDRRTRPSAESRRATRSRWSSSCPAQFKNRLTILAHPRGKAALAGGSGQPNDAGTGTACARPRRRRVRPAVRRRIARSRNPAPHRPERCPLRDLQPRRGRRPDAGPGDGRRLGQEPARRRPGEPGRAGRCRLPGPGRPPDARGPVAHRHRAVRACPESESPTNGRPRSTLPGSSSSAASRRPRLSRPLRRSGSTATSPAIESSWPRAALRQLAGERPPDALASSQTVPTARADRPLGRRGPMIAARCRSTSRSMSQRPAALERLVMNERIDDRNQPGSDQQHDRDEDRRTQDDRARIPGCPRRPTARPPCGACRSRPDRWPESRARGSRYRNSCELFRSRCPSARRRGTSPR